jgi:hypothetical protein
MATAETIYALAFSTAHYFGSASDGFDLGQVNRDLAVTVH